VAGAYPLHHRRRTRGWPFLADSRLMRRSITARCRKNLHGKSLPLEDGHVPPRTEKMAALAFFVV
jgi:hypothetical protein